MRPVYNMQLNCRILDSRLIYHDEDTLTSWQRMCCWRRHRHSNEIESTVMKAKTYMKNS